MTSNAADQRPDQFYVQVDDSPAASSGALPDQARPIYSNGPISPQRSMVVSMDGEEKRIMEFLALGVPPGVKSLMKNWHAEVLALGEHAPSVLIKALKEGNETQQYAAVVALRYFGYESYGHGYGPDMTYTYKPPGSSEAITVVPLHPPDRRY